MIRPRGHAFLVAFSSTTRITSPTWKFRLGLNHFCLSCKLGRYSFNHLRQKNQQGIVPGATSYGNTDTPFERPQVVKENQTAIEEGDLA